MIRCQAMNTVPAAAPPDLAVHIRAAREAEQRLLETFQAAATGKETAEQLACLARAYQLVISAAARRTREQPI